MLQGEKPGFGAPHIMGRGVSWPHLWRVGMKMGKEKG